MKFKQVLDVFKEAEEPENIIPLMEDGELRQALVAWKSVRITRSNDEDCSHDNECDRWDWLWSSVKCNSILWGTVAGIKPQNVGPTLTRLKGLRLIYPDGSINHLAKQYMQGLILAKLPKIKRPKMPEPPEPPKADGSE